MALRRLGLVMGVLFMAWIAPDPGSANGLQFPPKDEKELLGHFTYEIPRDGWTSSLRQPLSYNDNYALEFRENKKKKYEIVCLLHVEEAEKGCKKPYELCTDRIVAVLKLPRTAAHEAPILRCRLRGRTSPSDYAYFGIVRTRKVGGYYSPRLAWHVNLEKLTFEPVDGRSVECPVFGED